MTKAELVEKVAARSRLTKKDAGLMLDFVFEEIGQSIRYQTRFRYPGFGTFALRDRRSRFVRNPQTNEIMKLKAMRTVGFRPAQELKNQL